MNFSLLRIFTTFGFFTALFFLFGDVLADSNLHIPEQWKEEGFVDIAMENGQGIDGIKYLLGKILVLAKVIIEGIAIIFAILIGVHFITDSNDAEGQKREWTSFMYLIGGVFLLNAPSLMSAFDPANVFGSGASAAASCSGMPSIHSVFVDTFRFECFFLSQFIIPIENAAGVFAIFFIIISGVRMALNFGNEDTVKQQRMNVIASVGGLIVIALARSIQYMIFNTDASYGTSAIGGLISLIISFVGPLAVFALIGAGVYYILGGVDEEKQKKALGFIKGVVIALILVLTSFVIVNEFMSSFSSVDIGEIDTGRIITE
jgi:hypothetical protein